jgi:beta-glucosidase
MMMRTESPSPSSGMASTDRPISWPAASLAAMAVALVAMGPGISATAARAGEPVSAASTTVRGAWLDRSRTPDARAKAALAAMTIDEELVLLAGSFPMLAQMKGDTAAMLPEGVPMSAGFIRGIPRLGLAPVAETDASMGVSNTGEMRKGDVATALPAAVALGASFDPDLAEQGGRMIGAEARAKGFGVMLAGGVNLIRDPRGGRNFEYVSEDPYLSGVIGGRAIAGVQSNHIVSTMKHLALNATEIGRFVYNIDMSEAAMRESDLLAFQIAHEIGKPGSVMCAYNKVNGVYACENPFLLNDVLRRDWGFEGFVMSDWGAVHSTESLVAGLDQESGYQSDPRPFLAGDLKTALAEGRIARTAVDKAALRVLRSLFAHGVYDAPPVMGTAIDYAAHAQVAQAQAEAGIVLLRNDRGVLPIAASARRIAVIGRRADVGVLFGGGSAQVVPVGGTKLAIKPSGVSALMFGVRTYGGTAPLAAIKAQFPRAVVEFVDGSDPAAAATLAARADIAIVIAEKWASEGDDQADLALGDGQDDLIAAVAGANARTVVVLETGNAVAMPWRSQVAAIVEAWFPGQRGAEAIARVLAGEVNPSGRLPVTFPASIDQLPNPKAPGVGVPEVTIPAANGFPEIVNKTPFTYGFPEGSDAGYRWFDRTKAQPLYPFGHGLSYTSFRYADLKATGGTGARVSFRVTNSGARAGIDVPQVYVTAPGRAKRLVGWGRPSLAPGESGVVTVEADPRVLADFDAATRSWVIRPGVYQIEVGTSANRPVLRDNIQLTGTRLPEGARDIPKR